MNNILESKPWFSKILKLPEVINNPILKSLYEFYLIDNNFDKVLPIITSNSNISIRVLDWFVTNYCKKNNIIYPIIDGDKVIFYNVYLQYKSQLKGYKKKLFDPFCRKERIVFCYDEKKCIVTTIGQLNFFRWSIKFKVLDYIINNLDIICNDMNNTTKELINNMYIINSSTSNNNSSTSNTNSESYDLTTSSNSSEDKRKKRHELSTNINKMINKHNINITLNFE
jgi:hypothetical protein